MVLSLSVQYVDEQLRGRQQGCFNSVTMTFFLLLVPSYTIGRSIRRRRMRPFPSQRLLIDLESECGRGKREGKERSHNIQSMDNRQILGGG
jgi:hypothetical protein